MITQENIPEFIGQIIDVFEDFLTDRGITLGNPEVEQAVKDGANLDELAIIYGTDYGELQSALEDTMRAWSVI